VAVDSPASFLLYALIKFAAYAAWCRVGLWLEGRDEWKSAFGFGLVRLLLGVFFGVSIFVIGAMGHFNAPVHSWLAYFAVYAPVRWIEWSIMSCLLNREGLSFSSFLLGRSWKERLWRLGGIAVSHLADLPLILGGSGSPNEMLPVGRFLC
jgi:hypothetical protein